MNSDFDQRVVLFAGDASWAASPAPGVERRMLDRVGGEIARATSIVRYAPGSQFDRHVHGGGEEILVLDGVFGDEQGEYPAGTYIRNPPGSAHTPFSQGGCVLFVKLWQFAPGDTEAVRIDTASAPWYPGLVPGLSVLPLHELSAPPRNWYESDDLKALVLDANILIRAVLGVRVRGLIERYRDTVASYVAEPNFEEATEYLGELAANHGLPEEMWRESLHSVMVAIQLVPLEELVPAQVEANERIGGRDVDDLPALAAAPRFDCPIWTEDEDFFGSGVATWTTATEENFLRGE